jgi:hypothetical protein
MVDESDGVNTARHKLIRYIQHLGCQLTVKITFLSKIFDQMTTSPVLKLYLTVSIIHLK